MAAGTPCDPSPVLEELGLAEVEHNARDQPHALGQASTTPTG
jgi:hypothetical protein